MNMIEVYIYRTGNSWNITDSKQGLTTYETIQFSRDAYNRLRSSIDMYETTQFTLRDIVNARRIAALNE